MRLLQGRAEDTTIYSDDPAATARRWESAGAKLIHIVDLDGAFTGEQKNIEAIRSIRSAVKCELELGGGIRDLARIDMLIELGINRVILGTVAAEKPELVREACAKHPGKVIAGIDAKDGKVAVKGWIEVTNHDAITFAHAMAEAGVAGIIYTDIARDGMMTGPNLEAMARMVEAVDIPVIASGGVSKLQDVVNLRQIKGMWGVITGKALYAGTLDIHEAIRAAEQ